MCRLCRAAEGDAICVNHRPGVGKAVTSLASSPPIPRGPPAGLLFSFSDGALHAAIYCDPP